jgi:ppGpp synthetase/RelA/SpoT-type nucleotidyltranferase
MATIPIEKHREDIQKFKNVEESYKIYAEILKKILEKAVTIYAPLGEVQARAKKIESFSEKIIRKDKYKNPLTDMTDLCGARVITHFSKQVHEICKFIEENFEIDRENSLDLKSKLSVSEFGYRSIHYIVTPRKAKILDVEIPENIRSLKAEIQVRTFHEHIWADILHDRIYKSSINVTEDWRRESARLAAMLEEADNAFAGISDTIDQLSVNYQATPAPEKLKNEIEVLKVLIQLNKGIDSKDAESRLKLSRIYNLTGEWKLTVELLEPVISAQEINEPVFAGILREYGYALCQSGTDNTGGTDHLKMAVTLFEKMPSKRKELSLTYRYLANVSGEFALEYLDLAHKLSPENPYYFTNLLVERFSQMDSPSHIDLDLLSSKMDRVLTDFREHIGLGIEVMEACLNIGKILFLKSRFPESIETYITIMKMVMKDCIAFSKETLLRELKNIDKISKLNSFHAMNIRGILHLTLWLKYEEKSSKEFLSQFRSKKSFRAEDILIICGKSMKLVEAEEKEFQKYIDEAVKDFSGTVISGGTPSGIPGLLGSVTGMKRKNNTKKYAAIGYLPDGKETDRDYDSFVKTKSTDYSVLEPLSYWVDILFSNVKPEKVLVLGISGGELSALEYKMALAIGAKVCLAGKLGGTAQTVVFDPEWKDLPNLFNLPNDPLTVWAMVNQNRQGILSAEEVGMLAPKVHEYYRKKRRDQLKPDKETDINKYRVVMLWDKLPSSLQFSNLKQVAFMEHIYNRGGLKFQKADHPQKFVFPENFKPLDDMARLEHARWNAERLLDGWHYGPKDVLNKVTPYLVAWDDLDDDIKTYDYDPIKNFPELLMEIGYEIVEIL